MGFFSFLSRKTSSQHDRIDVKGQAYDNTVASLPPIRGTYPVAGNGPNVLGQLQQAARNRSQAQLAAESSIRADSDSSLQNKPQFLNFTARRPGTAPGNQSFEGPKSFSRSIRSSRSAVGVSDLVRYTQDRPPVPSIPSHHHQQISVDSFRDSRSIDILDAQDDIRPSQFHSRVRASGAREYGEDVAQRNLGDNSRSEAAESFYAVSSSGQLVLQTSKSGNGVEFHKQIHNAHDESDDDCAPPPRIPKGDLSKMHVSRHRSSSTSTWKPFHSPEMMRPSRPKSQVFDKRANSSHVGYSMQDLKLQEVDRRRSFNAFASAPNPGQPKPRPLSLRQSLSNLQYAPSSPPPLPRSRPKTSEGRSRRRSSARADRASIVDDEFELPPLPLRNELAWSSPIAEHSMPSKARGRSRHADDRRRSHSVTDHSLPIHSAFTRTELPQPLSRPSSPSSMEAPRPRTRSRGGASVTLRQHLDDITEHIPIRTSSLTQQSRPCVTPSTTSTAFSNVTFSQTANPETPRSSTDEAFPPSIKFNHGRERTSSMSNHSPAQATAEDEFSADTLVPSPKRGDDERLRAPMPIKEGLQLDQYLSDASDDSVDSFVAWKSRPPAEDSLLFRQDVYSGLGAGLPGLFDPPPVRKAPPAPTNALVAKNSPRRPSTRSGQTTPGKSRDKQRLRRSRASTYSSSVHRTQDVNFDSSADSDSDSFWERKRDRSTGLGGYVSLAEIGIDLKYTGLDVYGLREGDDAKVDINTAIRLRKEMKRRKLETNYHNRLLKANAEEDGCPTDMEN